MAEIIVTSEKGGVDKTTGAEIIVITSGKGGVGKTTSSAAIAAGLAFRGFKTVVIDFDIGLRNLDLIMGCERRVVFDFVNVIRGEANIRQALIKDKRLENLYVLPASQTRDKDALSKEGVEKILEELKKDFDYIICDSPAGIERGATLAMYFADRAIVVSNPEISSVRDQTCGFTTCPQSAQAPRSRSASPLGASEILHKPLFGDCGRSDSGARARPVLDNHLLAPER